VPVAAGVAAPRVAAAHLHLFHLYLCHLMTNGCWTNWRGICPHALTAFQRKFR
jgi:hypothetical protein